MLGHVPFRNILFTALVANEGPYTRMLPKMHLKVRSSVVFLVAALVFAVELVDIQVSLLMVP